MRLVLVYWGFLKKFKSGSFKQYAQYVKVKSSELTSAEVTSASLSQRGQAAELASCPTGGKPRDLRKDLLGTESAVLEQGQKREECQGL